MDTGLGCSGISPGYLRVIPPALGRVGSFLSGHSCPFLSHPLNTQVLPTEAGSCGGRGQAGQSGDTPSPLGLEGPCGLRGKPPSSAGSLTQPTPATHNLGTPGRYQAHSSCWRESQCRSQVGASIRHLVKGGPSSGSAPGTQGISGCPRQVPGSWPTRRSRAPCPRELTNAATSRLSDLRSPPLVRSATGHPRTCA